MIAFPNAKINLGLRVLRKRHDGYHDIESVLYPVRHVKDVLEIVPASKLRFETSGLPIPGHPDDNLILKAFDIIKNAHGIDPVAIHLHKLIPMGAGLGGGSANGAFALTMLNEIFELGLKSPELEGYAARLGSDCPFFIQNQPVWVCGRGTEMEPIALDLEAYEIRMKFPDVHVSTAEAYRCVTPALPENDLRDILARKVPEWPGHLLNDFEAPIADKYPAIRQAQEELLTEGAIYAAMTGSGAAVYGIFEKA